MVEELGRLIGRRGHFRELWIFINIEMEIPRMAKVPFAQN